MLQRIILITITIGYLAARTNSELIEEAPNTYSCYSCKNEDCEDPVIANCKTVVDDSYKCFIRFDPHNNDVAQLGCLFDAFVEDDIPELIKNKTLYVCDGLNCNDFSKFPNPNKCLQCSSHYEEACATRPTTILNLQSCNNVPYIQCYQRVKNQITERGCLYDLEGEDFYSCLTASDSKCKVCGGRSCNKDIIPSDRKRCHRCSSETDASCEKFPAAISVCPSYAEADACVAVYENGITQRGCQSDILCDHKAKNCQVCWQNDCNTADIKKRLANFYGLFQNLPLNCNTCKGDDCLAEKLVAANKCEGDAYQDCMTVFDVSGKVIQRGCENLVLAEQQLHCDSHPNLCFTCKANNCNNMTDASTYQECLYCDAATNNDCLLHPNDINTTRICSLGCVTSFYSRKSQPQIFDLVRTCFEDIEPNDYNSCTVENNCIRCSDNTCNRDVLPYAGRRLSCLHCEATMCEAPTSKPCIGYTPNDKCYIYFDNVTSNVLRMGCDSDLSDDKFTTDIKQYYVCDGDDCNDLRNLPAAHNCIICNSRTDKSCAVQPATVTEETECTVRPFISCYTRILPDGATERGCSSNLFDNELLDCLNTTSTTCKLCNERNCNRDIFPEHRLTCHICDSSSNRKCEASPESLSVCSIYDTQDTCVTKYQNGTTTRGCSSSVLCDVTNSKFCQKCFGNGCNTVNLAKNDDDRFGMWQDLPLTCLNCLHTDCNSTATTTHTTCELNNQQDCTTVFDENGWVMARGCSDNVELLCMANRENCFNCKSNNCNSALSTSDFTDCIYCNSFSSQECVWNPIDATHNTRKCQGGCMTALYPSFNSVDSSYELIRSCLNDKESSDQKSCLNGMSQYCSTCAGAYCNNYTLPENRLSCFMCKGETCATPQSKLCPLYKENDQCFITFATNNSISEMGCFSSFRNQDVRSIIKTKRAFICLGTNCNSVKKLSGAQSCAVCDSSVNVSCAVNPADVSTFNSCGMLPYTSCFTKLTADGQTKRGCLMDLPADEYADCLLGTDKNCAICSKTGCNLEVFPTERQQCYSCTSTSESTCDSFPTTKRPCPIFATAESCITALNGNITIRGCESLISCNISDSTTCRSCYGSACNAIDLVHKHDDGYHGMWQELPLKCHTCAGDQCLNSLGPSVTCSSQNINQDCMTVFNEEGHVVQRGCSDDVEDYKDLYCRQNPKRCFKCKSNECNIAWNIEEYVECLFCDSTKEPLCVLEPHRNEFNSRKCYKNCMVAMSSQQVIRSCLDDQEMWLQHNCRGNNSKTCMACSAKNCNDFSIPIDRLQCHICADAACTISKSQNCAIYADNDFCFTKYENGSANLMGCASSQNPSDIAEWSAENILHTCNDNNCNEILPLTTRVCLSCDSSTTPNCAQEPLKIISTVTCATPNDKCVSRVNAQGYTIRECASNLSASEQTCESLGNCLTCVGDKCNNEIYPAGRRKCHICNSTANKNCLKYPSNLSVCAIYDINDKCVSTIDNDKFLQRGCASQLKCYADDDKHCDVCNTDGCNTKQLAGSANNADASLFLISLMAIFAFIRVTIKL